MCSHPEVEFVVNFRLLPGNTVKDVKDHIAKAAKRFDGRRSR